MRDARSGRRGADRVGRCGWKMGENSLGKKKERRMTSSLCGSLRQGPGEISMHERPEILPTDTDIHHRLNMFLWQLKTKSNCTRWNRILVTGSWSRYFGHNTRWSWLYNSGDMIRIFVHLPNSLDDGCGCTLHGLMAPHCQSASIPFGSIPCSVKRKFRESASRKFDKI